VAYINVNFNIETTMLTHGKATAAKRKTVEKKKNRERSQKHNRL